MVATHSATVLDTTDIPIRPSSYCRGTRYVAGVCLEEIKFVERGTVDCPGEKNEKHQQEATGDQDEGDQAEKAATCHCERYRGSLPTLVKGSQSRAKAARKGKEVA